jgi:integrase
MPVYFDKATSRWRFTFNRVVAGRRVRATKLLPQGWSRSDAQKYERKETDRMFKVATGENAGAGERRTIADAVAIYCEERLPQLKAGKKQLGELGKAHAAYEGRFIDELPEVAREYAASAVTANGEPLSPATVRNRMAYVRAACRYAFKQHKFCAHDPAERLILPKPRNERHHYANRKEVLQIARKMHNLPARAAVLVAFYSGMRLAEVLRCKVGAGNFLLEDTKNGERRMVPIHPKLRAYLPRMPIKAAYRTIQGCFKRACVEVGLAHLHYHDLRHSAASAMINSNVDLYTVGGVLGHKSAQSTKRYAHLATDTLAAAVATIGKKCTLIKSNE